MKKISLKIILIIAIILMIASLAFNLFYFSKFHKNLKPLDEQSTKRVLDIISKNFSLKDYNVSIGKFYIPNKDFVLVKLEKNNSKKYLLIDLKKNEIMK